MQDRKIAQRYASALWKEGLKYNLQDKIKDELKDIGDVLSNKKIFNFFLSPKIKHSQKKEILNKTIKNTTTEIFKNFLVYLISRGRLENIYYIQSAYNNLWDIHQNILEVEVRTAISLDSKLRQCLIDKLKSITKKNILLENYVDKNVIGGVWIKIEDEIIDGTIANSIKKLKENLLFIKT